MVTKNVTIFDKIRVAENKTNLRHIKQISLDEISKMLNDQVRCLVVLLVNSDKEASEVERDLMIEMTRQYAIKVQELKYDLHKTPFC